LVVDEVLAVGDAEFQKKAIGKMQDVSKGEGRTVLFVSHNMASVRQLCKSGVILENGCMKFNGSVGDAIDLYIKGNLLNDSDISYIPNEKINQYRIKSDGTIHPVEILEVERISEARIDSTDELAFRLRLRNNESKQKLQNYLAKEYFAKGRLKDLEILKRRYKENWSESKVVDLTADANMKVDKDSKLEIKIVDV
jgi:lipopolysaccharide transport system ATP-binding protein